MSNRVGFDVGFGVGFGIGQASQEFAGGAAAFDPSSLFDGYTGEWWVADTTSMAQNVDGTGAVGSTGDVVGRWNGQLGNFNLTEDSTGTKPIYEATQNAVRFYGGKYYLPTGFNFLSAGGDATFVIYSRLSSTANPADNQLFIVNDVSQAQGRGMFPHFNDNVNYNGNVTASYVNGGGGLSSGGSDYTGAATDYRMGSSTWPAATAGGVYYDDSDTSVGGQSIVAGSMIASDRIVIGASGDAAPEMQVKLLLVINKVLTAEERASLFAYCQSIP